MTVVLVLLIAMGLAPAAVAATSVRVEFTSDGRCQIRGSGPSFRADLSYPRRTAELKCALPGGAPGEPVVLEVVLPAAVRPSSHPRPVGEFPRLEWRQQQGGWIGDATLPAMPAFVRVPADTGLTARLTRRLDAAALLAAAIAIVWSLARGRA